MHRLRGAIGAMAASLGGLDAPVFTGGVGERSSEIRALPCEGLEFPGIALDGERNAAADRDGHIDGSGETSVLVVGAREDLEIAAGVRSVLTD